MRRCAMGKSAPCSKDAKLIWSVNAESFEIAKMKQHEFLGWEPYKPYFRNEEDLRNFLPRNKFDVDKAQLVINLGDRIKNELF